MTHLQLLRLGTLLLGAGLVAACSDTGSRSDGISVTLKAQPVGTPHAHDDSHAKHSNPDYVTFRRSDGVKVDLQLGLLNLVPVELQRCEATVAQRLQPLLDALNPVGAAQAHAGHGGEAPEGAVNVVATEPTGLGTLVASAGTYCGVVVELQPGAAAKHGDGLDTGLEGVSVNVSPCYYPTTAGLSDAEAAAVTEHACIQAKAGAAARRVTLPFAEPVPLGAEDMALEITIATRYEEWFENVDFDALANSAGQQALLVDNIVASLQAHGDDEQLVNLAFALRVNGHEAVCGAAYQGLGNTAQPLRMEGFRFYASKLTLENASGTVPVRLAAKPNGTVYQDAERNLALIGHAQGCDSPARLRNLTLTGSAPRGEYDRLCFDLGVPFELNHSDVATAPSPLNVTGMSWSWLSGRVFLRFDAKVPGGDGGGGGHGHGKHEGEDHGGGDGSDGTGTDAELTQNFFVHLGSTGCSNGTGDFGAPPDAACTYPNRPRICLDYAPVAAGHPVIADIAPVIGELDITVNTQDTAPGCMSFPGDPECVTILPQLNLDFALSPNELIPRRDQSLFSVGP